MNGSDFLACGEAVDLRARRLRRRMRWATYNRLLDKLRAADAVADERLGPALITAQMSGFWG